MKSLLKITAIFSLIFATSLLFNAAKAQTAYYERIINFDSTIEIQKDSSLIVTEKIKIYANGNNIKHGIYRDFPTIYANSDGVETKTFTVLQVLRDGKPERSNMKSMLNGKRLYIGDSNVTLPTGTYEYTIRYETKNQLGFFDDHDEIYWNVTGNGWEFPIENVRAVVKIPDSSLTQKDITFTDYYGPEFSSNTWGKYTFASGSVMTQTMGMGTLAPKSGYTIVVGFPKGIVKEPPKLNQFVSSLEVSDWFGLILPIFSGLIFLIIWKKHGKDEAGLPVIPVTFAPPKGITPAQVGIINNMGEYSSKLTSTIFLNLAIKGYIKILESAGNYTLVKTSKDTSDLLNEDKIAYENVFGNLNPAKTDVAQEIQTKQEELQQKDPISRFFTKLMETPNKNADVVEIDRSNYLLFQQVEAALESYLKTYSKKYVVKNTKYLLFLLVPVCAYVMLLFGISYVKGSTVIATYPVVSLTLFFGLTFMFKVLIDNIQAQKVSPIKFQFVLQMILIFVWIISMSAILITTLNTIMGPITIVGVIITLFLSSLFATTISKRTVEGRQIQDQIEGFKIFLTSQKDYISEVIKDFPDKFTMYEKYLPFAIALEVETQWSGRFKSEIEQMMVTPNQNHTWIAGMHAGTLSTGFASSFASNFASAVSSARTNPSSRSGFSGGHSGGGGGGGGGGGW